VIQIARMRRRRRRAASGDAGLTPDQQIKIDSIMDRQGRVLRAVRGRVQPQLDSIITGTRRAVDSGAHTGTAEEGGTHPAAASSAGG
jgi:hypothetical protein